MNQNKTMRAVRKHSYGPSSVLTIEDVPLPSPDDDSLLVRVISASVNPLDWHFMTGTPYLVRLQGGLTKPKNPSLGVDFAGVVEEVGKNVTEFAVGDEVFGGANGAFAQYVKVSPKSIALKPKNISFDEAAAVPIAAFTALQALRDKGGLMAGQKVLVNGAAGGVGTMAVQIAKAFGAEVTGVCSARNVDMVSSIGADHVIDYTQDNFTKGSARYDLFVDNIGNHSLMASKRVLSAEGIYVLVGGPKARFLGPLIRLAKALAIFAPSKKKAAPLLATQNKADLEFIRSLLAEGKLKPVLDQTYTLAEAAAALDHLGGGHARGKILIAP